MKIVLACLGVLIVQLDSSLPGFADKFNSSLPAPAFDVSSDNINKLLKSGITQFQAGNTVAAENSFNEVLKIEPGNETAHFNLGVIAEQRKDFPEALKNYQAALRANPYDKEIQTAVSAVSSKLPGSVSRLPTSNPNNQSATQKKKSPHKSHLRQRAFNIGMRQALRLAVHHW